MLNIFSLKFKSIEVHCMSDIGICCLPNRFYSFLPSLRMSRDLRIGSQPIPSILPSRCLEWAPLQSNPHPKASPYMELSAPGSVLKTQSGSMHNAKDARFKQKCAKVGCARVFAKCIYANAMPMPKYFADSLCKADQLTSGHSKF